MLVKGLYCILKFLLPPTSTVDQLLANGPLRQHLGEGRPTNGQQFNDQLPVCSLAQLVRALHRYRRGLSSSPVKPVFFQAFLTQLHKMLVIVFVFI